MNINIIKKNAKNVLNQTLVNYLRVLKYPFFITSHSHTLIAFIIIARVILSLCIPSHFIYLWFLK